MNEPRVLIVDDSPELTETVARYLGMRGYLATVARNGDEALSLARETSFDAVLTDLRMAGLDGLDVLTSLRALQPATPVILMTAFGTVKSAVEALQQGAFDYLTKPFSLADLRALLDRAIERKRRAPAVVVAPPPVKEEAPPDELGLLFAKLVAHELSFEELGDRYVEAVVRAADGNKAKAAEILGVDPSTLYRWTRRRKA